MQDMGTDTAQHTNVCIKYMVIEVFEGKSKSWVGFFDACELTSHHHELLWLGWLPGGKEFIL